MPDSTTYQSQSPSLNLADGRVGRAIELIWREAALLDAKEYETWEGLYADDGIYVIPIDRTAESFDDILNIVYDDARMRRLRVERMTQGHSLAAVDAANTVRTVSRFVPLSVTDETVSLKAGQILVAYKHGTHRLWAADNDYTVRLGPSADEDRIVRKVVRLVDSDEAVPAAGFLL